MEMEERQNDMMQLRQVYEFNKSVEAELDSFLIIRKLKLYIEMLI